MIERAELQDAARRAFGADGLRPGAEAIWGHVTEMGWLGMAVPEDQGGLGLGREALGVGYGELGRVLAPGPIIGQMLVIEALSGASDFAQRAALLERAIGGEIMSASLEGRTADFGASDGRLTGTLRAVPDADRASHVLAIGRDAACVLVPMDAPGVALTHRPTWDETRRLFDVTIDVAADAAITIPGDAGLADRVQAQLLFALAADSLGGADAALALSIDYLKTRRQFGRPLALFQVLKHRVADLRTLLTASEALFWSYAEGGEDKAATLDPLTRIGTIKSHATRAYLAITEESIQLHGGIGLTEEYYCHHFLKRSTLNLALGGGNDRWDEAAGRALLAAFP